jgi:hypothetical protein
MFWEEFFDGNVGQKFAMEIPFRRFHAIFLQKITEGMLH